MADLEQGFALVITLSLMVLLTLLAVGLLSLSAISLRSASSGSAQSVARENARMAMMLALGQLQKLAGPDQRVTAHSSLLKKSDGEALANESWVGVWRTDGSGTEPPGDGVIQSNGSAYFDSRTKNPFDAKAEVLDWIVSGKDLDPSVALTDSDSVEIRSGLKPVRAPLLPVQTASPGRMAYWVSDESTKAKLSLVDPYFDKQPDLSSPESGGYNRVVSPLQGDPSVFFPGATRPSEEQAGKLLSNRQIELSSLAGGLGIEKLKQQVREHADDLTVHSRSVLSDPVAGGMKADLTAYLEDGPVADAGGDLKGISDLDGIIAELPDRNTAGPKFGMLRNWFALREQINGALGQRSIGDRLPATYSTSSGRIVDPGRGFIKPLIQPVMSEAVYYLRHVINTDTTPARMVELIYPRVVLWNPFNVTLKTSGHIVHFDFRLNHKAKVSWKDSRTNTAEEKDFNLDLNFNYSYPQHLAFSIPPTEFEPGEALCFTSGGGQVSPYSSGDTDIKSNPLSATANPADLNCFRREWNNDGSLPPSFDFASAKVTYSSNSSIIWNTNQRTQGVLLHSLAGTSGGAVKVAALLSGSGPPVVRQISLDNYSRGNNGRWLVGYNPDRLYRLSEASNGGILPDSLLAFGGRFRYLYETYANRIQGKSNKEPWFISPLIHHNLGAPNIHRWPIDNIFGLSYISANVGGIANGSGNGPHIYAYGPIAQARQWSEWLDPEVLAHRSSGGKYRTSVFTDASFSTSNSTYPIYDLPSSSVPLVSLGALQHVQLSPFAWHPTQTIGHSFPSPYIPATRTALTSRTQRQESTMWAARTPHLDAGNFDITGFDKITSRSSKDILFNDVCFEVNQSLWDRYFLSAIPRKGAGASWAGSKWNLNQPLPNPRLKINESLSQGGSQTELASFFRAARSLWLDGGFNVNSTSISAWECLLRSFRDIELPNRSGAGGSATGTGFPGVLVPENGGTTALAPINDTFWNAYRKLTDDEIFQLASEIVTQVHERGPFLGVSDFVNRRLVLTSDRTRGDHAYGGAIQGAIDYVNGLNEKDQAGWRMPTKRDAEKFQYGADYWGGPIAPPEPQSAEFYERAGESPTRAEAAGAAAHLNQADILQQIGSVLVARGDTFVIRGYGEAVDKSGKASARAWCETVVQRTPVPINPDSSTGNLNPKPSRDAKDFGRYFAIESFRWLSREEV